MAVPARLTVPARRSPRLLRTAFGWTLAFLLAACGGGGGVGGGGGSTSSSSSSTGSSTSTPTVTPIDATDAARLADQATFGATPATIAAIQSMGASAWIDSQLATAPTGYPVLSVPASSSAVQCPTGSPSNCYRDNYTAFPVQRVFLANAVNGNDQLRQRVAFALSQIFVTSSLEVSPAYATREYQQLLLNDAFVNYRQLLQDVTLSPMMGAYLNMANNAKANPSKGTKANENYGREVMQLLSLGVNQLNADGSVMTDASGNPLPTYTQATVDAMSAAFTGWTYPPAPGATSKWTNPSYFIGSMVSFDNEHDTTAKTLLNNVTLPAGQTAAQDLQGALDNIFNHPNVGPFIGKQLIQFLTTSNPSPAYVSRISAVFANNGSGVRGDLGAVVKAILMDPEARGDSPASANFGKLREPVEFVAAYLRLFNAKTDGVAPLNSLSAQQESPFSAPSVFNFYPPTSPLPGNASLSAPQFGILNTATLIARMNEAASLSFGNPVPPDPTIPGAIGTTLDFSAYDNDAEDNPAALVATLNTLLMHGSMPASEQSAVVTAISGLSSNDASLRAETAVYLMSISPRFQIKR